MLILITPNPILDPTKSQEVMRLLRQLGCNEVAVSLVLDRLLRGRTATLASHSLEVNRVALSELDDLGPSVEIHELQGFLP
jgi:hypothetical protein